MTNQELQNWIASHGRPIKIDGVVGPETRLALRAVFGNEGCIPASISQDDIGKIAARLGCTPKQLSAVAKVESGGSAFDRTGSPKLLYERHLFHRFTGGKYSTTPWSNPAGGGYNDKKMGNWDKLIAAAQRDVQAAFAACSWGKFQVLGAHADGRYTDKGFLNLGYASPIDMAYATVTSEAAHYDMLARYIEKAGLMSAVRKLSTNPEDNRAFAKGYNGKNYEQFAYHTKLAAAMK